MWTTFTSPWSYPAIRDLNHSDTKSIRRVLKAITLAQDSKSKAWQEQENLTSFEQEIVTNSAELMRNNTLFGSMMTRVLATKDASSDGTIIQATRWIQKFATEDMCDPLRPGYRRLKRWWDEEVLDEHREKFPLPKSTTSRPRRRSSVSRQDSNLSSPSSSGSVSFTYYYSKLTDTD